MLPTVSGEFWTIPNGSEAPGATSPLPAVPLSGSTNLVRPSADAAGGRHRRTATSSPHDLPIALAIAPSLPSRARTTPSKGLESIMLSRSRVLPAAALALLALAAWTTAASAATARVGKYRGKTSQQLTIKLTVRHSGTRVDFAVPYAKETQCTGNST